MTLELFIKNLCKFNWTYCYGTLKVLKVSKWNLYEFSHTVRETRTFGIFRTSKTIDGLNLEKPFWVFSNSPRDKTFTGFPYE